MKLPNTDFLRNRKHKSGYGVTYHKSGWMGESTYQSKQQALEAAQARVLQGDGCSASVFPRRTATMHIHSQRVTAICYWLDSGLQFSTSLPSTSP